MSEGKQYIVEKVIGKKIVKGKIMYFVKWKGFGENDNTWEPIENFSDPKPYKDYERSLISKKKNKKQKKRNNETSNESSFDSEYEGENKYFLRRKKASNSPLKPLKNLNEKIKIKKERIIDDENEKKENQSEEKNSKGKILEKEEKKNENKKEEEEKEEQEQNNTVKISEKKDEKNEGKLGINKLKRIKNCYKNEDDSNNHFFVVELKDEDSNSFKDQVFTFEDLIKNEPQLIARYLYNKIHFTEKK